MERIVINTQATKAIGTLPLNVNGQDYDILFGFESLEEFKRTVQMSIKAQSLLTGISNKNIEEDPTGMLDAYEEVSRIYRDMLKILLGVTAYADLTALIGDNFPIVISQPIISAIAELYSGYYKSISAGYLDARNKL